MPDGSSSKHLEMRARIQEFTEKVRFFELAQQGVPQIWTRLAKGVALLCAMTADLRARALSGRLVQLHFRCALQTNPKRIGGHGVHHEYSVQRVIHLAKWAELPSEATGRVAKLVTEQVAECGRRINFDQGGQGGGVLVLGSDAGTTKGVSCRLPTVGDAKGHRISRLELDEGQRYRHVKVQITTSLVLTAAIAANAMSARTAMSNDGFFEGGPHETLATSIESPVFSRYVACDEGEVFVLVVQPARTVLRSPGL